MRIALDAAQTLVAVLDEGSIHAAAARLHVTASAVSQRIKALEEQVGQVLLVRARPVRATAAAEPIVRYARQAALLERDAADAIAAQGTGGPRRSIPLAVNADSLATWFLAPLAALSAAHDVVFDLHRDDQDFTARLLETGTVLGAVTSRATPVAGCHASALGMLRYRAVAAPGYAARWFSDGVTADALAVAPVVDFDRRDELQTRWLRAHAAAVSPPRHFVPASADFADAVRLGLGWAMLPLLQADAGLRSGALVALGGDDIDVPLHWQQWNLDSPMLRAVADAVIAEGRRVLSSR